MMPQKPVFTPEVKPAMLWMRHGLLLKCNLENLSYTFRAEGHFCIHLCLDYLLKVLKDN